MTLLNSGKTSFSVTQSSSVKASPVLKIIVFVNQTKLTFSSFSRCLRFSSTAARLLSSLSLCSRSFFLRCCSCCSKYRLARCSRSILLSSREAEGEQLTSINRLISNIRWSDEKIEDSGLTVPWRALTYQVPSVALLVFPVLPSASHQCFVH